MGGGGLRVCMYCVGWGPGGGLRVCMYCVRWGGLKGLYVLSLAVYIGFWRLEGLRACMHYVPM